MRAASTRADKHRHISVDFWLEERTPVADWLANRGNFASQTALSKQSPEYTVRNEKPATHKGICRHPGGERRDEVVQLSPQKARGT